MLTPAMLFNAIARTAACIVAVSITVASAASPAAVLYSFPLDTNPGWTCEGQWQFGKPQGKGTYPYDPLTGFTGTNVYGYNLAGDYANNVPTYYLTTTPLDFSRARNVTLIFRRWLGVEAATYDQASIEASHNGVTWTTIWRHTGSTVTDTSWLLITNSLAFVADGRSNVYVRWGMGPTDYTVTYYGWNIDDIVFEGDLIDDLTVAPTSVCAFTGLAGGPFSPATYTITLTNTGNAPLTWQAHTNAAWLTVSPVSGTLPPGGGTIFTAALTATASTLTSAVYSALLVCSNLTSGVAQRVPFVLTVQPPSAALVHFFDLQSNPGWSTQGQWAFGKPQGGGSYNKDPLTGYTGTNVYGYNLAGNYESYTTSRFFLTTTALDCSYATGMTLRFWRWLGVGPSYYDRARVEISTNAIHWHPVWENASTVSDSNWVECVYPIGLANNRPLVYVRWGMGPIASYDPRPGWNIDDIALTGVILEGLRVAPAGTAAASGQRGGPFTPSAFTYELRNAKNDALTWRASVNAAWVTLSPASGTLTPSAATLVTAALNEEANRLTTGTYTATIIFSNTASGATYTRPIVLTVRPRDPVVAYGFYMDTNPGWVAQGQWQFGKPLGFGSGKRDPLTGYTGTNVYGYNLVGDYSNNIPKYTLTTTPLDCSNLENVALRFWRWLGVEQSYYDKATIEVSNNGTTWTTIWQNGTTTIDDGAWTNCVYDISAFADRKPTVYIRWGMGPTDYTQTYCGWNLDDVEIIGRLIDDLTVTPADGLAAQGYRGGPMNPPSKLYTLRNVGGAPLPWTATGTQPWLTILPASGILAPGATQTVSVAFNSQAHALAPGSYADTVTFANTNSGVTQTRSVSLTIIATPRITVQPQAFSITVMPEQVATRVMTVGNAAGADGNLTFSLTINAAAQTAAAGASVSTPPPPAAPQSNAEYVPGELLVRFAPAALTTARANLLAAVPGATITREYDLVKGLALVTLPPGIAVASAQATAHNIPGVLYAEPNYLYFINATPNDPRLSELWGLHNTGQTGGTPDADIDAPEAWDTATGSREIIVAVIDTGVEYTHPDLASNMWRNPGEVPGNGVDDDANGFVDDIFGYDFVNRDADPMDDHNHGTHCAGTIAAVGNNGIGVAGVCWRARIMALKFLSSSGSGSSADAIACIQYATRMGARVLNNSWGGGGYSQALKDAIDTCGASGVVFCAAAGNNGTNNDTTPQYPASYDSPNIIAVMSTDHTDQRSTFSCYGRTSVDIGAPGSSILSTVRGGSYSTMSGTSMATPHVAGACALLLARNPMLSVGEVQSLLYTTVDPTLPGLCVSGGRLNLARAIAAASDPWLTATPLTGTNIAPGATLPVTVTATAGTLAPGTYRGELIISCNDRTTPTVTVPVIMLVLVSNLVVTPDDGLVASGLRGGPFTPSNKVYTLINPGTTQTRWSASASHPWLAITPISGTLAPGASAAVTVALTAAAAALPTGFFSATITFAASGGAAFPRPVLLTVLPPPEPPAPPAPPAGLAASDGLFSHAVLISWNASSGATAYLVYRNTANATNTATPISPQLSALSYHDTNVIPGTLYYYWVRAANSNGWSAFSNGDSGFASADPHIAITTPSQTVSFHQTTLAINGTNNNNVAGVIMWENYQGLRIIDSGVIPVHSSWTIPAVTLATGDNDIWVWCTNRHGAEAWDTVLITRLAAPPAQIHHFTIRLAPDFATPILSWSNIPATVLACTNRYYTRAATHWFTRAVNVSPPWADTLATQWPTVYYRLVADVATSAYDVGKFTVLIRQAQSPVPVENWISSPFDFMDDKGNLIPSLPFDVLGVGRALNNEARMPAYRDAVYSQLGVGGELRYASRGNGVWHVQHPVATNWYRNQMYKLVINRAHVGPPKPLTFFGRVSTNDPAYVADIQQSDGTTHRQNWVAAWFPWIQSFDQARVADVVTGHPGAPPNRDAVYSQSTIGGAFIYATRGTNTWITTAPAATNLFPGQGYMIIIRRLRTGPARPWRNPRALP